MASGRPAVDHDPRLRRWLEALLDEPGLTAVSDLAEAQRVHVDDALVLADMLVGSPVLDVGSGGGSPGIPLAAARQELNFVLLESSRRRCDFLARATRDFPNVRVVCARAELHAKSEGRDAYENVITRALAPPPAAAELCLPLVAVGGRAILLTGAPEIDRIQKVAAQIGGGVLEATAVPGTERRYVVVIEKIGPTPPAFPRRPGLAQKRPLA